jgi:hypothetical protein
MYQGVLDGGRGMPDQRGRPESPESTTAATATAATIAAANRDSPGRSDCLKKRIIPTLPG